jgi:hypothetical protein
MVEVIFTFIFYVTIRGDRCEPDVDEFSLAFCKACSISFVHPSITISHYTALYQPRLSGLRNHTPDVPRRGFDGGC